MVYTLSSFYTSSEWKKFRKTVISERLARDGEIICAHCKKAIMFDYDIIAHHCNIYLTEQNVNDFNISLNPSNIQLVHHICHNRIHNKFANPFKKTYIVFGSPSSGKTTYINSIADENSLIVDIDRIYEAINNNRNSKLLPNVMQIWNQLIDMVKTNNGRWQNCYVVVANCRNIERLYRQIGGELIFIDTDKETCLERGKDKIEKYGDGYRTAIEDFHREWNDTYKQLILPLM